MGAGGTEMITKENIEYIIETRGMHHTDICKFDNLIHDTISCSNTCPFAFNMGTYGCAANALKKVLL